MNDMKSKTDEYWKQKLTPEQYAILRRKGTEPPWSGKYVTNNEKGIYTCVACGQELFSTDAQYESTTPGLQGWPAFSDVLARGNIELKDDDSFGMHRTEIVCAHCGSHLGHLFSDPTLQDKDRQHYCVNSCALSFKKNQEA